MRTWLAFPVAIAAALIATMIVGGALFAYGRLTGKIPVEGIVLGALVLGGWMLAGAAMANVVAVAIGQVWRLLLDHGQWWITGFAAAALLCAGYFEQRDRMKYLTQGPAANPDHIVFALFCLVDTLVLLGGLKMLPPPSNT